MAQRLCSYPPSDPNPNPNLNTGIFTNLLPHAASHNARLVLVNRRDYPGATPYTASERAILAREPPASREELLAYAKARAREVYDLLVQLVAEHDIPPADADADANTGGIVLVGWSFGTAWVTALLAHVASFPVNDVELARYVWRVVFYDTPYHTLGFAPPADPYNPLTDPTLSPADRTRVFANWVSGYYAHGALDMLDTLDTPDTPDTLGTPDTLERRAPLASPPPTLSTLTDADRAAALYPAPGDPGGSDALLLDGGIRSGLFAALLERAIRAPSRSPAAADTNEDEDEEAGDGWAGVEVRYVWCDRSVWATPWGVWNMRAKLEREKEAGTRDVTFLRVRGANHFVHWDESERALAALLAPKAETDN